MKSLQNEYNLIKEGKGNKELFIKEARTLFPNIVTNVLTFDQAIHNLNERGIISEGFTGELSQRKGEPNWFKIFSENTEGVKATLKDTDKAVVEKETAGYNYEDKKNNNNISTEEILKGYYVEMKDPKNADKTEQELKNMVFKNLEKDPLFYIKNAVFGVKGIGYTEDHPGLGPTKEVTGKYKSSGMEPVKLNESMHGSSDGDYEADQEAEQMSDYYYDKGLEAYLEGDYIKAENFRRTALRYGSYVGRNDTQLPPYDKNRSLEEASNTTANELASYIGVLQKEINAEKDPKKLKMLKQDLEDTKKELAKKTKKGMNEYTGGRIEVPRNYGMDFDDDEEDYEDDEDQDYYDEEGRVIPLRSPLHPNNRNMRETTNKLKEGYGGLSLQDAMRKAYKESLNGYVQHVEDTGDGVSFRVSDFYDSGATVVSFEDGRKFNDNTADYDMSESKTNKRATLPNKKKGIASEIDIKSKLEGIVQQAWAEPDLNKAKELVSNFVTNTNIKSKNTILKNLEGIKSKPRLDFYMANSLLSYEKLGVKEELTEAKKRAIDKQLAEIDKLGEVAALEYKMGKVQEKIEELKNRLTMTESDDMKDMVDKKAISEIKKDIAYLEKTKKMYEAKKAKAAKKVSSHTAKSHTAGREEVLDEAQAPIWEEAMRSVLKRRGY
jgi:cob(I)alamin adenosyltransferase